MKRMKFLSFFITFALILNSLGFIMIANAADTTSGFEFTYDTTLNGLNETVNVERVNDIGGRSEAVAKITSNGSSSGYIGKNYMNQTNNNTGIWAFETDMYIKAGEMPEGGKISFWLNPTTGWDSIVYCRFESTKATNSTISMDSYPVDKWFTVRVVLDYTSESSDTATFYITYDGETRTVDRFSITNDYWQANGLARVRLTVGGVEGANGVAYLDNTKYYQMATEAKNIYAISDEGEMFYFEDFDTGINYNFTSATAAGNLSAIRATPNLLATADDPMNSSNKVLHYLCNGRQDFITRTDFKAPLTGTQVAEAKFYIPSTGVNAENTAADEDIVVDLAVAGSSSYGATAYGVRMGRNTGYSKTTDNSGRAAFSAPLDKWFTLRFVVNYSRGYIESQIIEDGVITVKGSRAMPSSVKEGGIKRLYFARGEAATVTEYYLDNIKYYEVSNIPFEINFDKEISATASAEFTAAPQQATISLGVAPGYNHGNALKVSATAVEAGEDVAQQLVNIDSRLYPLGKNSGITQMDVQLYFSNAFAGENERVVIIPNTDNITEVEASSVGTTINPNNGALASNTLQIWGDGIILKNGTNKVPCPIGEWFTIRSTYNINTNLISYELVKEDGTVTQIGEAIETGNFATYAKNTGVKRLRVQYFKPAKLELPEDVEFYVDNIKFTNVVPDGIVFDGVDSYTASVNYSADGTVNGGTKLILAQYNASNELLAINMYTPVFSDGTGTYKIENIAKADGATKAKLMYVDSTSAVHPLAPSIEK